LPRFALPVLPHFHFHLLTSRLTKFFRNFHITQRVEKWRRGEGGQFSRWFLLRFFTLRIRIVWSGPSETHDHVGLTHHLMGSWRVNLQQRLVDGRAKFQVPSERDLVCGRWGRGRGHRHPPTGHTTLSLAHKISSIGSIKLKLRSLSTFLPRLHDCHLAPCSSTRKCT